MGADGAEPAGVEHLGVLVVGAGVSGIAAAYALSRGRPDLPFAVVDAFDGPGGTWQLHRYPGVRSDSDLFTYGFRFKPWQGAPIASGQEILDYLSEAIDENGLAPYFRFGWRLVRANWDSAASVWRLEGIRGPDATPFQMTCRFLWMCQGYYLHDQGFTPQWPGMADFEGRIVHPQTWPEDLELEGRRVIVVGSGATAATLVPALAPICAHVTMLQRSPTYFSLAENRHDLAETLRELQVDPAVIHEIVRRKVTFDQHAYLTRVAEDPQKARDELLRPLEAWMSASDIAEHFSPAYLPWQQRVAVTPSADLFRALQSGRASILTDQIEAFTPTGVRLISGQHLDADIVVTATGFELTTLGNVEFAIDGAPLDLTRCASYRSCLFTGIPNLARSVGYLRLTSWTLRAELVADFVLRLLAHMDAIGAATVELCEPEERPSAPSSSGDGLAPFNATYVMRALHQMPRSIQAPDWQAGQYWAEKDAFPAIDLSSQTFAYKDESGRPLDAAAPRIGQSGATRSPHTRL